MWFDDHWLKTCATFTVPCFAPIPARLGTATDFGECPASVALILLSI
jgi:hypothetical protein